MYTYLLISSFLANGSCSDDSSVTSDESGIDGDDVRIDDDEVSVRTVGTIHQRQQQQGVIGEWERHTKVNMHCYFASVFLLY